MKTRVLIIIGLIVIGQITLPVNAQYVGDRVSNDTIPGEYIGGWGMNPEEQSIQRHENDQKNAFFVLIIGIPSLILVGFVVWRKRR